MRFHYSFSSWCLTGICRGKKAYSQRKSECRLVIKEGEWQSWTLPTDLQHGPEKVIQPLCGQIDPSGKQVASYSCCSCSEVVLILEMSAWHPQTHREKRWRWKVVVPFEEGEQKNTVDATMGQWGQRVCSPSDTRASRSRIKNKHSCYAETGNNGMVLQPPSTCR